MHAKAITLLAFLLLNSPVARSESRTVAPAAKIDLCIVSLIDDKDVSAEESGPLVSLDVDEGSPVKEGDLMAKIDDRQSQIDKRTAELRREAANARAASDVDIKIAEATYQTAEVELQQRLKILKRSGDAVTASEIRRLELARDSALYEIDKRRLDRHVAQITANSEEVAVKAAENSIARRKVLSPIDGQVVAVYRQRGEWVNAGEPVLRVARLNRLRVEGHLSAKDFNPSEIGNRPVTVDVQLARGRVVQFSGKVTYISPMLKAGDIYRVRAEVDNRAENGFWLLQPGATVGMTIHLKK